MKTLVHRERTIYLILVFLTFSLSSCLGFNAPFNAFDNQVEAGVAFSTWHTVITGRRVIRIAAAHSNRAHVIRANISISA